MVFHVLNSNYQIVIRLHNSTPNGIDGKSIQVGLNDMIPMKRNFSQLKLEI